jgi:hypothetical protein
MHREERMEKQQKEVFSKLVLFYLSTGMSYIGSYMVSEKIVKHLNLGNSKFILQLLFWLPTVEFLKK